MYKLIDPEVQGMNNFDLASCTGNQQPHYWIQMLESPLDDARSHIVQCMEGDELEVKAREIQDREINHQGN